MAGGARGHCKYCLGGRENLCELAQFTGWTVDGGYAERVVARGDYVYPLPESVSDAEAAPLLCAGIIGYRALRLSGIMPGGLLGLFGFGSSAHLAIQIARHWGCEVAAFCHLDEERELASELGATWVGGYDDLPPAPLDAAVTFAPVGSVVVSALRATGPGGTVAVNAIHLDRVPEFSYDLLWRERSLRSVANFTRADARAFLDLAVEIPIRPETTVSTSRTPRMRCGCSTRARSEARQCCGYLRGDGRPAPIGAARRRPGEPVAGGGGARAAGYLSGRPDLGGRR